eukprot:IDg3276t1
MFVHDLSDLKTIRHPYPDGNKLPPISLFLVSFSFRRAVHLEVLSLQKRALGHEGTNATYIEFDLDIESDGAEIMGLRDHNAPFLLFELIQSLTLDLNETIPHLHMTPRLHWLMQGEENRCPLAEPLPSHCRPSKVGTHCTVANRTFAIPKLPDITTHRT